MGTIVTRRRASGTTAYMARIVLKGEGRMIHTESRTFDRRAAAAAWMARREIELRDKGPPQPEQGVTLAEAIERYRADARRPLGRTKDQVLGAVSRSDLAAMRCSEIRSHHIVEFAKDLSLDRKPQTVGNYLSHLGTIFQIARPAWGVPLDPAEMQAARVVMHRLGVTGKSQARDRRPTIDEITRLVQFFDRRARQAAPMGDVVLFAMFSTRRQEEITRIRWEHVEQGRVLVEDMKHPGEKQGNHVWCDLPPEAEAVLKRQPRRDDRVFPYGTDAISASFTRACKVLGIEDLHFHDLRHEGISRLFEMGRTIPHVAAVSGHRSWTSLKRYTHIRQAGDRWAGWTPRLAAGASDSTRRSASAPAARQPRAGRSHRPDCTSFQDARSGPGTSNRKDRSPSRAACDSPDRAR